MERSKLKKVLINSFLLLNFVGIYWFLLWTSWLTNRIPEFDSGSVNSETLSQQPSGHNLRSLKEIQNLNLFNVLGIKVALMLYRPL